AIATSPLSPELKTALSTFHFYYPSATLVAELVTPPHEQYIVRAVVSLHGQAIGSAMATAEQIETAEDRAKYRAIMALLAQHHREVPSLPSPQAKNSDSSPSTFALAQPTQDGISPIPQPTFQNSFETPPAVQPSQQLDEFPLPQPSSLGSTSGNGSAIPPAAAAINSSLAAEKMEPSATPLESVPLPSQPEKSDRPLSQSTPPLEPLDISDDSDRPIDLIQEDEMPAINLAEDYLLDPGIPAEESGQLSPSKTRPEAKPKPEPEASQAKSKKRSFTPKISTPPTESPTSVPSSLPDASLSRDLSDIIAKTSVELKRLGWTNSQGRDHLQKVYGKRSRQQLTDPELIDFLEHLERQPSPTFRPDE
ncbi:MAG: hypothetical protein WBA57_06245, partial [Elainellaceae cyanobacterium]